MSDIDFAGAATEADPSHIDYIEGGDTLSGAATEAGPSHSGVGDGEYIYGVVDQDTFEGEDEFASMVDPHLSTANIFGVCVQLCSRRNPLTGACCWRSEKDYE